MKYILIKGASRGGKSTTINAICKKLKPTKIWQLNSMQIFVEVDINIEIINGTYIIEVNGKLILVVAGSPTEQDITITILVKLAIKLNFNIEILLVAMRSFETKPNFDTPRELEKLATKIFEKKIYRIEEELATSTEFKDRIADFVKVIKQNI